MQTDILKGSTDSTDPVKMVSCKWWFTLASIVAYASAFPEKQLFIRTGDAVPREYNVVYGFFKQTSPDTDNDFDIDANNFGLYSNVSWSDVADQVDALNKKSNDKKYKLIFAARHGEGYHNVAPDDYDKDDWECYWQEQDGDGKIEWFDAALTPNGELQIKRLNGQWKTQLKNGTPLPQSYYSSPLRRTLQTFQLTWSNITNFVDDKKYKPLVRENLRETYGIATESKRHDKDFIVKNWPFVNLPNDFSSPDPWWIPDKEESHQHRDYRAGLFLNDIFTNDDNQIISVTTHSGFLNSFLKVVNHRDWDMDTGAMIPLIVEASDFGPYKQPDLSKKWKTLPKKCKDYKRPN